MLSFPVILVAMLNIASGDLPDHDGLEPVPHAMAALVSQAAVRAELLFCVAAIQELLGEEQAAAKARDKAEDYLAVALTHRPTGERYLADARKLLACQRSRHGCDPEPVAPGVRETMDLADSRDSLAEARHELRSGGGLSGSWGDDD